MKPLPKLTDEQMIVALHKMDEDEQIAFMARLFDLNDGEVYRALVKQPWLQRWITLHASTIAFIRTNIPN